MMAAWDLRGEGEEDDSQMYKLSAKISDYS